jgi:hypothetical protein
MKKIAVVNLGPSNVGHVASLFTEKAIQHQACKSRFFTGFSHHGILGPLLLSDRSSRYLDSRFWRQWMPEDKQPTAARNVGERFVSER